MNEFRFFSHANQTFVCVGFQFWMKTLGSLISIELRLNLALLFF